MNLFLTKIRILLFNFLKIYWIIKGTRFYFLEMSGCRALMLTKIRAILKNQILFACMSREMNLNFILSRQKRQIDIRYIEDIFLKLRLPNSRITLDDFTIKIRYKAISYKKNDNNNLLEGTHHKYDSPSSLT